MQIMRRILAATFFATITTVIITMTLCSSSTTTISLVDAQAAAGGPPAITSCDSTALSGIITTLSTCTTNSIQTATSTLVDSSGKMGCSEMAALLDPCLRAYWGSVESAGCQADPTVNSTVETLKSDTFDASYNATTCSDGASGATELHAVFDHPSAATPTPTVAGAACRVQQTHNFPAPLDGSVLSGIAVGTQRGSSLFMAYGSPYPTKVAQLSYLSSGFIAPESWNTIIADPPFREITRMLWDPDWDILYIVDINRIFAAVLTENSNGKFTMIDNYRAAGQVTHGWQDGIATDAKFGLQLFLAIRYDTIIISDAKNFCLRKLTLNTDPMMVSTFAGKCGFIGTIITSDLLTARFRDPGPITTMYVAEINRTDLFFVDNSIGDLLFIGSENTLEYAMPRVSNLDGVMSLTAVPSSSLPQNGIEFWMIRKDRPCNVQRIYFAHPDQAANSAVQEWAFPINASASAASGVTECIGNNSLLFNNEHALTSVAVNPVGNPLFLYNGTSTYYACCQCNSIFDPVEATYGSATYLPPTTESPSSSSSSGFSPPLIAVILVVSVLTIIAVVVIIIFSVQKKQLDEEMEEKRKTADLLASIQSTIPPSSSQPGGGAAAAAAVQSQNGNSFNGGINNSVSGGGATAITAGAISVGLTQQSGRSNSITSPIGSVGTHGRFSVMRDRVIGQGGFGTVYLAVDHQVGINVACKESNIGRGNTRLEKALRDEFEQLCKLDHPNVVRVYGIDMDSDRGLAQVFIEWMAHGSVHGILAQNQFRLHENAIRRYTKEALQGLEYLHGVANIVHRDIKSANILVGGNGEIKISDFGTAKDLGGEGIGNTAQTATGITGTPLFLAPECLTRNKYSRSSDMWAMACSVIEMATAKPPWDHLPEEMKSGMALMFHIGNAKPPNHHPLIPDHLSPPLKQILEECFDFDPAKRPSATQLLALDYFQDSQEGKEAAESVMENMELYKTEWDKKSVLSLTSDSRNGEPSSEAFGGGGVKKQRWLSMMSQSGVYEPEDGDGDGDEEMDEKPSPRLEA